MKDRVPTYAGRVRLTPVANQDNIYDLVRADEPIQEGTPLNKANLLTDETAQAMGLTSDATPNDAFAQLTSKTREITLAVASWGASTVAQTVSVSGVTATNNIIVSLTDDATADEVSASAEAMVRATAQGNGTITFTCLSGTAPAIPLTVSVVILG